MNLLLPPEIVSQLVDALAKTGKREIGGVLMGEHVDIDIFSVKELTIQRHGGTFAAFIRFVEGIVGPLRAFFRATKHSYTRFNYLGEWHSHHSFSLTPSSRDHNTMSEIVMDPELGAHFIVLLGFENYFQGFRECDIDLLLPLGIDHAGHLRQE